MNDIYDNILFFLLDLNELVVLAPLSFNTENEHREEETAHHRHGVEYPPVVFSEVGKGGVKNSQHRICYHHKHIRNGRELLRENFACEHDTVVIT